MADKFIRHGATFNGDGTTSALAASNGAAGAWNNINILTGTTPAYGTLAAGDVVYIRSKDESAADLAVSTTTTITLGSGAASTALPITWVLDNGDIWAGIDGTLSVTHTAGGSNGAIALAANNRFIAKTTNSIQLKASAAWSGYPLVNANAGTYGENIFIDVSMATDGVPLVAVGLGLSTFVNLYAKYKTANSANYFALNATEAAGYRAHLKVFNLTLDITATQPGTYCMFSAGQYGNKIEVFGGRIIGAGGLAGGYKMWNSGIVSLRGFRYPISALLDIGPTTSGLNNAGFSAVAADDLFGTDICTRTFVASSRKDGNFPTLNATLPNSASTPWAWWVYPKGASRADNASLSFEKLYSAVAGDYTVTCELLVGSLFTEVNASTVYLVLTYVQDSDGALVTVTSQDVNAAALATSTAAWSYTTYATVSFDKRKISLTTPTAIKQDTVVTAQLVIEATAISTSRILIVCPDIQLEAVV